MVELLALEEVYASETTLDAGSNPVIDNQAIEVSSVLTSSYGGPLRLCVNRLLATYIVHKTLIGKLYTEIPTRTGATW